MDTYSNMHRSRDVLQTLLACFEAIPPEPITAESSGRQVADCLTKHGVLTFGGKFGQWRPLPAGLFHPIQSIEHLIAACEYLTGATISAATAEMVAAHLKVKSDVDASLTRLKLCAHGMESPEYQE